MSRQRCDTMRQRAERVSWRATLLVMGTERDAYIRAQYYAGRSAIELGAELGLSRSQVHRIVAVGPPPDDADDDQGTEVLLDSDGERVVVPPLTYVGTEGHNGKAYARWVDTVGPVNELEIWRHRFRNGSEGDAELEADMDRQLLAAGWWRKHHYDGCYQTWEPPAE